jgi:hypothetical protein
MRSRFVQAALLAVLVAPLTAQQKSDDPEVVGAALRRIADRVEDYYSRAQSIVATETVRIQRQLRDLSTDGHIRRLVYDLRVEWRSSEDGTIPEANVVRELVSVDGRPPKKGDDNACMDPEPVTPEPMMMLMPGKREKFVFSIAGLGKADGRAALMLDYKARARERAEVKWKEHCVSVSLPGWSRGRVWVDAATHDVMRMDEHLVGMFQFAVPRDQEVAGGPTSLTVERFDSSIRYQQVRFREPEETLMLPRSIESTSVWRNTPVPRVRVIQDFTNYRRFIGDSRIVPDVR